MKLTRISGTSGKEASALGSPLDMLLGCHTRIRHFVQLGRTLASAEGVPPKEIAEAADSLFRYFDEALPIHEADENESLFPRLRDALPPGNLVREAAEAMVEQHKAIDELAVELLSMCASLGRQPERLPALARRLDYVTRALEQIFIAHLGLEETVIFPALPDLLTPAQLSEMVREMNRRRPKPGSIHLVQ